MSRRNHRVYYYCCCSKLVKRKDRHVKSEAGIVLHVASDKNEREPWTKPRGIECISPCTEGCLRGSGCGADGECNMRGALRVSWWAQPGWIKSAAACYQLTTGALPTTHRYHCALTQTRERECLADFSHSHRALYSTPASPTISGRGHNREGQTNSWTTSTVTEKAKWVSLGQNALIFLSCTIAKNIHRFDSKSLVGVWGGGQRAFYTNKTDPGSRLMTVKPRVALNRCWGPYGDVGAATVCM